MNAGFYTTKYEQNFKMTTESYYEKYLPLIKSKAKLASKATGIEFDELFSEANLIFCESISKRKSNSTEGQFIAYLKIELEFRLKIFTNKMKNHFHNRINFEIGQTDSKYNFILVYHSLSQRAQMIVDLILNAPKELFEIREETRSFWDRILTIKMIKEYINKIWGWPYCEVERLFNEIKEQIK